jgi:hypothetical protein
VISKAQGQLYLLPSLFMRVYPKVSGLSDNEINNKNKHSLRSNTKSYYGKTQYTDSQNSNATVHGGRELYHLQLSPQAASPETFGYTSYTTVRLLPL